MTSQVWQKTGRECCVNVCLFPLHPGSKNWKMGLNILKVEIVTHSPHHLPHPRCQVSDIWYHIKHSGFRLRAHKFGSDIYGKFSGNKDNSNRKLTFSFPSTISVKDSILSMGLTACSGSKPIQFWQMGILSRWPLRPLWKWKHNYEDHRTDMDKMSVDKTSVSLHL